jgi:hypothetical protein
MLLAFLNLALALATAGGTMEELSADRLTLTIALDRKVGSRDEVHLISILKNTTPKPVRLMRTFSPERGLFVHFHNGKGARLQLGPEEVVEVPSIRELEFGLIQPGQTIKRKFLWSTFTRDVKTPQVVKIIANYVVDGQGPILRDQRIWQKPVKSNQLLITLGPGTVKLKK